jgi:hypothetical protein
MSLVKVPVVLSDLSNREFYNITPLLCLGLQSIQGGNHGQMPEHPPQSPEPLSMNVQGGNKSHLRDRKFQILASHYMWRGISQAHMYAVGLLLGPGLSTPSESS